MKPTTPERWNSSNGIILEQNAEKAVRCNSNVLVIAGPGAGKTELLAQKACFLFQTNKCRDPQKILAISFKKDAADNLKKRVEKRCGVEINSRFVSMTYDAFSKSLLDHFRLALPTNLRPKSDYLIDDWTVINAAFEKAGFKNLFKLSQNKLKNYYDKILGEVSLPFSKNNSSLGEKVWTLLLDEFSEYNTSLTFKMICILANYIIKTNPRIKRALQLTYTHVFLDEFQDTTNLQYNLVLQCFQDSNTTMTAVGDSKQRIMLWAGALKSVFSDYQTNFNAEPVRLLMNHRSAPRLVALQKMMYASLNEPNINVGVSDKWKSGDGAISLLIAENETDEAQTIAADIAKKVATGTDPNEICILCKQRPQDYTSNIINELGKYQIRARIENEYQDLIKEPIVEIIICLLQLAIERKRPNDWNLSLTTLEKLWNIISLQQYEAYYQMEKDLIKALDNISNLMKSASMQEELHVLFEYILNFLGISHVKSTYPIYRHGEYLSDSMKKFEDYFWEELTLAEMNWPLALENFKGLHSVPIMTIHKSKGLEYTCVYFVGLEDSAFWNFKNQPKEDRCAFFVALSRAKSEVAFTFCNYRFNMKYPQQHHNEINEFFELLKTPEVANIIKK